MKTRRSILLHHWWFPLLNWHFGCSAVLASFHEPLWKIAHRKSFIRMSLWCKELVKVWSDRQFKNMRSALTQSAILQALINCNLVAADPCTISIPRIQRKIRLKFFPMFVTDFGKWVSASSQSEKAPVTHRQGDSPTSRVPLSTHSAFTLSFSHTSFFWFPLLTNTFVCLCFPCAACS